MIDARISEVRPVRVQLSRKKGWRMPPNTVTVDRSTKWGNPYRVARMSGEAWNPETASWGKRWEVRCPHWLRGPIYPSRSEAVAVAIDSFRDEVAPYLPVEELRGVNLACWCHADQPCHADVLLELANADLAASAA